MLVGVEKRTERGKGHCYSAEADFKSESDMHAALKGGKTKDLSLRLKMRRATREEQRRYKRHSRKEVLFTTWVPQRVGG